MCNSLANLDDETQEQVAAGVASLSVGHDQNGQSFGVQDQPIDLSAESTAVLRRKIMELQKEYDQEARNLRSIQAKNKELNVFERLRRAHADETAGLGSALDGDQELKERVDLVAASWQKLYDLEQDVKNLQKEFGEDNVWDYAYNNSRGIE